MAIQKTSTFLWLSKLAMKIKIENICLNYICSTDCSVVSQSLSEKKKRKKSYLLVSHDLLLSLICFWL